jgi:transcriptional regulator with XRE-family HTH domain
VQAPRLRHLRHVFALSQAALAQKAGVKLETIARLEKGGEGRPSTLQKLAHALGVPAEQLTGLKP